MQPTFWTISLDDNLEEVWGAFPTEAEAAEHLDEARSDYPDADCFVVEWTGSPITDISGLTRRQLLNRDYPNDNEAHAYARIVAGCVAAGKPDLADWAPEDDGDWGNLWPGTDDVTVLIVGDTVHVHVHTIGKQEVDHAEVRTGVDYRFGPGSSNDR